METLIQQSHIVRTPGTLGGKPRIAGHRISVAHVAIWHLHQGYSPDEICFNYGLTLGEVYAALAYYYDNREAIERSIAEEAAFAAEMKAKNPSRLAQRLRG